MASHTQPCGRATKAGGTCKNPTSGGVACHLHRAAAAPSPGVPRDDSESDPDVDDSPTVCGRPTQKNKPCANKTTGGQACHLHRGGSAPAPGVETSDEDEESSDSEVRPDLPDIPDIDVLTIKPVSRACILLAPGVTAHSQHLQGVKKDGLRLLLALEPLGVRESVQSVFLPASKSVVLEAARNFFTERPTETDTYILLYSGHGYTDGAWSVEIIDDKSKPTADKSIQPHELFDIWKKSPAYKARARLVLLIDSCFSGVWAAAAAVQSVANIAIQTSCSAKESSDDYLTFTQQWLIHDMKKFKLVVGGKALHPQAYVSWDTVSKVHTWTIGSKEAQFWSA